MIAALASVIAAPAAALGLLASPPVGPLAGVGSWAVFYGYPAPAAALAAPDLLVLEPDHPWKPAEFRREGQRVLAYLSLGEIHETRAYFPRLKAAGVLAGKNPNWPGAVMVDPRAPRWHQLVLDELMPALLARGYDGFFLDTLDVAEHLEGQHPGAKAAMTRLLLEMHRRYPQALLVANGGLALLPGATPALSALAVESIFTDYQFKPGRYQWRAAGDAAARAERFAALRQRDGLPVLVLEYADPQDTAMREAVSEKVRQAGFVPFVSDIGLTTLGLGAEPAP